MEDERNITRFGVFEADLEAGELRRNGAKVKLQEQPFQVLAALLEKPGAVVTKEELQRRIWNGDTFVDFDRSLATAVNKIRQALGDSATRPRFVETVPKKGYRFIGGTPPPGPVEADAASPRSRPAFWAALGVLGAIGLALLYGSKGFSPPNDDRLRAIPFTSYPGSERSPSFSPDGQRIVFTWNGEQGEQFDVYAKLVGAENATRLTQTEEDEFSPAWSPDGRTIAFMRAYGEERLNILTVPASGGAETKIGETAFIADVARAAPSISWSADGEWLAALDRPSPEAPLEICAIERRTGEKVRLGAAKSTWLATASFALNPLGGELVVQDEDGISRVVWSEPLSPASRSVQSVLLPAGRTLGLSTSLKHVAFFPDGKELIYAQQDIDLTGRNRLVRRSLDPSDEERTIAYVGDDGVEPTISRDGSRLAYTREPFDLDLWRFDTSAPEHEAYSRIIRSTVQDRRAWYSPDGSRIAFESSRSGVLQVWASDADGGDQAQLTRDPEMPSGTPRWSPDAERIAFDRFTGDSWDVFVMNADGGAVRQVTFEPGLDAWPRWSADGESLFVSSDRGGSLAVWIVPVNGDGDARPFSVEGARASAGIDAEWIYCHGLGGSILKARPDGREQSVVLDQVWKGHFALAAGGAYFVRTPQPEETPEIQFLDFETNQTRRVGEISERSFGGMSATPDGRYILYTVRAELESDIMLVENFK